MVYRCEDPDCDAYQDYGARGISVCDRWRNSFDLFFEDMGAKPSPKHTIDRIDNDGNYEPSNCRWATRKEQANNRRNTHIYDLDGESFTGSELSARFSIPMGALNLRIHRYGWTVKEAVVTPLRAKRRAA